MRLGFVLHCGRAASALAMMAMIAWQPSADAQAIDPNRSPALCGSADTPEAGIQGDVNEGTVNCGLTLLSEIPAGGHAQGSGHCIFIRTPGGQPYTGEFLQSYDLSNPLAPRKAGEVPARGLSESIRAMTTAQRAVLVSGNAVYDISSGDCALDDNVNFKGEIEWPSAFYQLGIGVAATSSHEIAISHDAMRVYSGLGFAVADISDLEHSETWTVKNWTCEMNAQTGFLAGGQPPLCDAIPQPDYPRQYSHSSDDNLEGTRWYGANQAGDSVPEVGDIQIELLHQVTDLGIQQAEPPTARIVDISRHPDEIEILDTLAYFPGHSMAWWRTEDGREFIVGANENVGQPVNSCLQYPRPVSLGNSLEAYIAEVTGGQFNQQKYDAYRRNPGLTLAVNRPENCDPADLSGSGRPKITEYTLYNKHGAAMLMVEYGTAGLRVFDLRDGDNPREVAYFNDGNGFVHSGVFHYNEASGIIATSGSQSVHVLELQPQVIEALGLPCPTDPAYPRGTATADMSFCSSAGDTDAGDTGTGGSSTQSKSSSGGGSWPLGASLILVLVIAWSRRCSNVAHSRAR